MSIDLQGSDLNKFILVGDRILIKPKKISTIEKLNSYVRFKINNLSV